MAKLSTKERDALPSSAFVFPDSREYPVHDRKHAIAALSEGAAHESGERLAKIKRTVKRRFPDINVKKAMRELELAKNAEVEVTVPVWKNDAKQILYTTVLSPGVRDSQDDIVDADEIEKAAHKFLVQYRKHDVQHSEKAIEADTVESYIAPVDFEIETPTGEKHMVLKGAWVMGIHVKDPETWERCHKADHPKPLTGVSIGGSGVRIPETA